MQTALRSAFPIDARRLVVFTALVLAVIQARTVVLYSLKTHVALAAARDLALSATFPSADERPCLAGV